jgi:hypothetical protein
MAGASVLLVESQNAVSAARAASTRDQYLAAHDRSVAFDASGGALMGAGGVLVTIGVAVLIHRAVRSRAHPTRAWRAPDGAVLFVAGAQ